jgi:hypothetical protein
MARPVLPGSDTPAKPPPASGSPTAGTGAPAISGPADDLCVDEISVFTATLDGRPVGVRWSTAYGDPGTGTGATFQPRWLSSGGKVVIAATADGEQRVPVRVKGLEDMYGPMDPLEPNQLAVFRAVTDPPGLENDVVWSTDGTLWNDGVFSWSTEGTHWVAVTFCGQTQFGYVLVRTPDCLCQSSRG